MDYLPINLKISEQNCLVVGGGGIALRKAKQLLKANAILTVVSPEFHQEFYELNKQKNIHLIQSNYQSEHLHEKLLVIAATDQWLINVQIFNDAKKQKVLVNVVDQPDLCQFITPSIIDRTPLTIAISSAGTAPVLARMLREKIEWMLPSNIGEFLLKLKGERKLITKKFPNMNQRRKFWESYFEKRLNWSVANNVLSGTPQRLDLNLSLENENFKNTKEMKNQFSVIAWSTNIQSIDDLTINNIKDLQKANDVYLTNAHYDLLENLIRRDADIHIVKHKISDDEINDITSQQVLSNGLSNIVVIK